MRKIKNVRIREGNKTKEDFSPETRPWPIGKNNFESSSWKRLAKGLITALVSYPYPFIASLSL